MIYNIRNQIIDSQAGTKGDEKVPYVTPETIQKAREVDLFSYLSLCEPGELVRCGSNEYCTKEHDSLKISHGKWFWWSRGIGGASALDFLVKVRGMDFVSAVRAVCGEVARLPPVASKEKPNCYPKLYMPPTDKRCERVRKYLHSRGIDGGIIDVCIEKGMIAEDAQNGYVLFIGFDERGKAKHCAVRATDGTTFKKDVAGSDKAHPFSILSENGKKPLRVFESAIDLLSFATLMKSAGRDFTEENLLSLAGIYLPKEEVRQTKIPVAITHYLEQNPHTPALYLHLDNDYTGRRAAYGITAVLGEQMSVKYVPPPVGKDFNDYLKMTKEQMKDERKTR